MNDCGVSNIADPWRADVEAHQPKAGCALEGMDKLPLEYGGA
jgi:hypothetical protein